MKRFFILVIIAGLSFLFADNISVFGNIDDSFEIMEKGYIIWDLEEHGISAEALLIVGDNGTSAYIESSAIEKVEIVPGNQGWHVLAPELPAVCSIKNIQEIWIYQGFWDVELAICDESGENKSYTPFSWNLEKYEKTAESEKNGYYAAKYLPAEDFLQLPENEEVDISLQDGKKKTVMFELKLFEFTGVEFYYNNEPVRKIECK